VKTVKSHVSALSFFFRLQGLPGFCSNPAIKLYLRALERDAAKRDQQGSAAGNGHHDRRRRRSI